MGQLFYLLFIRLYPLFARLLALFNPKARKWVQGRQQLFTRLQQAFQQEKRPVVWMHCASLGEFEQGRPILEELKKSHPQAAILLTFFSPSGYEIRKNYEGADYIFYLPMDAPSHARLFFDIAQPQLVLFVKYEYWFYYLREAWQRKVPLLLVSGIFRPKQAFFQWYGHFYRQMLANFTHFFVQNQPSAQLLATLGYSQNVSIAGDTRFDRVQQIAADFYPIASIEQFCDGKPVIVAGSTWTEDDEELDHYVNTHPELRFIIAPHDIGAERLKECRELYKKSILFSEWERQNSEVKNQKENTPEDTQHGTSNIQPNNRPNCLIIDNIGMLSRLYHYATICYVGGGFGGDGIHNILEAAVYAKPVVFGPVYDKYQEGIEMIAQQAAFSVTDALELEQVLNELLADQELYKTTGAKAGQYVQQNTGATQQITAFIQEKRLLTN
jgi:3-deoxy-D-manno-octulosonic-acid transferase